MNGLEVRDASGRLVAPPQVEAPAPRPSGPWDFNQGDVAAMPAPRCSVCAAPDHSRIACPYRFGGRQGLEAAR